MGSTKTENESNTLSGSVINRKGFLPLIANMLFVSKNCSLEKVAFMNSSCFMICVLDSFYGNSKAFSCYSRKMFFRKGFEPEVHGNLTRLRFLSSRTQ